LIYRKLTNENGVTIKAMLKTILVKIACWWVIMRHSYFLQAALCVGLPDRLSVRPSVCPVRASNSKTNRVRQKSKKMTQDSLLDAFVTFSLFFILDYIILKTTYMCLMLLYCIHFA